MVRVPGSPPGGPGSIPGNGNRCSSLVFPHVDDYGEGSKLEYFLQFSLYLEPRDTVEAGSHPGEGRSLDSMGYHMFSHGQQRGAHGVQRRFLIKFLFSHEVVQEPVVVLQHGYLANSGSLAEKFGDSAKPFTELTGDPSGHPEILGHTVSQRARGFKQISAFENQHL